MNGDKAVVTVIVADTGGGPEREARLSRSTWSVRAQSLRGVELIIAAGQTSRNDAMAEATGDYLLFLDSGDVLDRHAARTALASALDTDADVVSVAWQPCGSAPGATPELHRLFRRTAHIRRLADRPELLYDSSIGSKFFRTAFLRRIGATFLGDGTAASRGFVMAAYLQAHGITLLPQRLMRQHVEPALPEPQQLLAVHRALDRLFGRHASPELVQAKNVAFLEADLPCYLLSLPRHDDDEAQQLLSPLHDYVDLLGPEAFERIGKMVQIAVFMVRRGDPAGARSAVDYLERGHVLPAGLFEEDGRVYWSRRYLDTDTDRAVLDVTSFGFRELPLSQLIPGARIDDLQVHRGNATLQGTVVNPLGRISRDARLALSVGPSGTDQRVLVPIQLINHDSELLTWRGMLDLPSAVRNTWRGHRSYSVELSIADGAETTVVPIAAYDEIATSAQPLLSRRRWYPVGSTLFATVNRLGNLALRLEPRGRVADRAARFGRRVLPDPAESVRLDEGTAAGVVPVVSLRTKGQVFRHLLVRLPMQRRSVVFESHLGLGYSDNPRYVSEELQRRGGGFRITWAFVEKPSGLPPGVRAVRRNSWRHVLALARAHYWVDNQGLPQAFTKPDRVTYLETWHGSALKRMGADTPGFRRMPPERQERHRRAVARWDYFVARSEHDVRTLVPALEVRGEILRSGYPRNDPLVQLRSPEQRAAVRAELGLPQDATLVLYAPTFRETYESGLQDFELPIDLDQLFEKLPDHRLLVRTHYLQRLKLPAATHAAVRDVSHHPDITPLLVAADVLITDYSSVMFDFANTGRPMVFYVYDYDDYANSERGVYWELAERAPGPLVQTSAELIQALATLDAWRPDFEERYRTFVAEFGEYDTGTAARQVVDRVFFGTASGE